MDVYHQSSPEVALGSNYDRKTSNFGTIKIEMSSALIGNPGGQGCTLIVCDYKTKENIGVMPVSTGTVKIDIKKDFYNYRYLKPGNLYLLTFKRRSEDPITKIVNIEEGGDDPHRLLISISIPDDRFHWIGHQDPD